MKYKVLFTLTLLLIICIVFQQIHMFHLKEQLGTQVIRRIDSLNKAVQLTQESMIKKENLEIKDLSKLEWMFMEQKIKIESINQSVIFIRNELDGFSNQLENNEQIGAKDDLLIELSKLKKALNIIKEECEDIPINYYYLRYKQNNETMKKAEKILMNY